MNKNFSIFKNTHKKEGSTQPDYKISMKVGEEYVEIGAGWIKDGKSGKYISCKLSDSYADHTKGVARKGFQLVMEGQTETVKEYAPMVEPEESESEIPF